jgi:hypothetical protein
MRELKSEKWIVILRKAVGCEVPERDKEGAVRVFNSRVDARKVCKQIRRLRFQFKPKSKAGLGYTCRPVKAEITVRWGDD